MTEKDKKAIIEAYQTSKNSIQDIARIFKVDVYEVMEVIGEGKLKNVTMIGDQIDESEAGPGAQLNYGKNAKVEISVH